MADIITSVVVQIEPLVSADAELFRAEFNWPGGTPAPTVKAREVRAEGYTVDRATLAATGAVQTYRFVIGDASPYSFAVLSAGIVLSTVHANEAVLDAFWKRDVFYQPQTSDPGHTRVYTLSEMAKGPITSALVVHKQDWDGAYFNPGQDMTSNNGPLFSFEVDTFNSGGSALTAYPFINMVGWPDRVQKVGATYFPGLMH
jgi:hypothetical protein